MCHRQVSKKKSIINTVAHISMSIVLWLAVTMGMFVVLTLVFCVNVGDVYDIILGENHDATPLTYEQATTVT